MQKKQKKEEVHKHTCDTDRLRPVTWHTRQGGRPTTDNTKSHVHNIWTWIPKRGSKPKRTDWLIAWLTDILTDRQTDWTSVVKWLGPGLLNIKRGIQRVEWQLSGSQEPSENDRESLERRETKTGNWGYTSSYIANCETPHICDGPKWRPTTLHCPLGLKYLPMQKVKAIADCFENQFTLHDICNEIHEWLMEARVKTPLTYERERSCDVRKLTR